MMGGALPLLGAIALGPLGLVAGAVAAGGMGKLRGGRGSGTEALWRVTGMFATTGRQIGLVSYEDYPQQA